MTTALAFLAASGAGWAAFATLLPAQFGRDRLRLLRRSGTGSPAARGDDAARPVLAPASTEKRALRGPRSIASPSDMARLGIVLGIQPLS